MQAVAFLPWLELVMVLDKEEFCPQFLSMFMLMICQRN